MNIDHLINSVATDTDRERLKRFPGAAEFYAAMLRHIPFDRSAEVSVLNLGSGDGLLADLILARYPSAHVTLMDSDTDRIEKSQARFADRSSQVTFQPQDFARIDPTEKYDLVVSALVFHHLNDIDKRAVYRTLFSRLNPGGWIFIGDRFKPPTEYLQDEYIRIWQEQSLALGAVQSDLSDSIDRMYDDRDAELESQLEWIRHSGYRNVDIYYKNMLFAVVGGHRLNF